MTLLLQAVARLVTLIVLAGLALAALAVAVFSVPEGESGLAQLADLLGLHLAIDEVDSFLDTLEVSAGAIEVLACFGAALAGTLLIAGVLLRRAERAVRLPAVDDSEEEQDRDGVLSIRRRPLSQMGVALAGRVRDAEGVRSSVRARRRRPGGSVRVRARVRNGGDPSSTKQRLARELEPLTGPLHLRTSVNVKQPRDEG